ncbi:MAG: hypothetical protein ACXV95_09325 [Acidimicrobiales bacterium]
MLPDAVVDDPQGLALDDLTRTRTWAELGERATRPCPATVGSVARLTPLGRPVVPLV